MDNKVQTTQFVGYIRTFASVGNIGEKCNVFLMNKNDVAQKEVLELNALPANIQSLYRMEYKGKSPESRIVKIESVEDVLINQDYIEITLAPLSITVLQN